MVTYAIRLNRETAATEHIEPYAAAAAAEFSQVLLSVAGLVKGPHVTSESEIGGTDSAALRTSRTCLQLCGSCVTSCTSFFRAIVIQPFKKLLRPVSQTVLHISLSLARAPRSLGLMLHISPHLRGYCFRDIEPVGMTQ